MGDRDRTRASSLHCGSLRALRCETLMFFFLPCDAQTRDLMYEADLRGRARKHLGAVAAPRGACARARHRFLCHAVWQAVCAIGSRTGVPSPVWACTEARWSGDASLVDVPTRCVALCTVCGSQTRADRSIPV